MERTFVADAVKDAVGQIEKHAEMVNLAFPSLEGNNFIDLKDLKGEPVNREEIAAAMKQGSAWIDLYGYKPGQNTPARKQTFVRKVQFGQGALVGSGIYTEGAAVGAVAVMEEMTLDMAVGCIGP